jgi:hypothetical protein
VGQPVGAVGGGAGKLSVSCCDEFKEVLPPEGSAASGFPQFVQNRIPSTFSLPHFPHLIIETPSHPKTPRVRNAKNFDAHEA